MIQIDAERARRMAWLALWIYIAALGVSAVLRVQGDFLVYYRTGHRVLRGIAIYQPGDSDRFLYAPIFAIAFAPFALFPRHAAQGLWFIVNATGLVAFVCGAAVMLFGRKRQLSATLLAVPIVLSFRFIGNNVEHGQINLPVLALCAWAIIYAREGRPLWSGAMIAAAVLIKPFALLAALYMALRRRWAVFGWAIVAGMVLLLLPVVVFGPYGLVAQTSAYLHSITSMTDRYRTMLTNQSAVSAAARLIGLFAGQPSAEGSWPAGIGMAVEGLLIAGVSIWTLMSGDQGSDETVRDRYLLAAWFCLMPALAPISWKSYFVALMVPYMLLTDELWNAGRRSRVAWYLFVASVVLNLAPGKRLSHVALFYSAHFLSSLLALAAVAVLARGDEAASMESQTISAQAGRTG